MPFLYNVLIKYTLRNNNESVYTTQIYYFNFSRASITTNNFRVKWESTDFTSRGYKIFISLLSLFFDPLGCFSCCTEEFAAFYALEDETVTPDEKQKQGGGDESSGGCC